MRQGTWQGIDHARSDPVLGGRAGRGLGVLRPRRAGDAGPRRRPDCSPVTRPGLVRRVAARRRTRRPRPPTADDLDYHLTTLFPPVRPRGYVEIRCIDALPDRWWPAVAALTATLVDDPVAADLAADACAPVADAWEAAARAGLADPAVRRAVAGLPRRRRPAACPGGLRPEVEALAELVDRRPHPSRRAAPPDRARSGPLRVLEEEARA